MNKKIILVVEDEERMITLMEEALEDWNSANTAHGRSFKAISVNSIASATEVIYDMKVDCAIVDLRLPTEQVGKHTSPEAGNTLAADLIFKNGMPVAIVSGYPAETDDKLTALPLKRFDKADDGYEKALHWLGEQWILMESLRGVRSVLELSTGDVFARRIWPNWSQMADALGAVGGNLATAIARQYASHTAELLGQQDAGDWHPFENYVLPSFVSDRAHTGDIFLIDGTKWIVLTPQCDMATGKVPNVLLAACLDGEENWKANIDALKAAESASKVEKAKKYLGKLVNQNLPASQHFLPPIPGTSDPIIVSFSTVRTIPLADLNNQLVDRVASVSPPFLSNLVQRFGAFISRTGQPNIDVGHF